MIRNNKIYRMYMIKGVKMYDYIKVGKIIYTVFCMLILM